jgi:hypothetical protein
MIEETPQAHADRTGHAVLSEDTYSCSSCGHVTHVDRYVTKPSPGIGVRLRRAARKRARQTRKRGRR